MTDSGFNQPDLKLDLVIGGLWDNFKSDVNQESVANKKHRNK